MKKIFEYMGWQYNIEDKCRHEKYNGLCPLEKNSTAIHYCKECPYCFYIYKTERKLDGNDMVLAINKMQTKGDWEMFVMYSLGAYREENTELPFNVWLFGNPANFFRLFEEAIKEGVIK